MQKVKILWPLAFLALLFVAMESLAQGGPGMMWRGSGGWGPAHALGDGPTGVRVLLRLHGGQVGHHCFGCRRSGIGQAQAGHPLSGEPVAGGGLRGAGHFP